LLFRTDGPVSNYTSSDYGPVSNCIYRASSLVSNCTSSALVLGARDSVMLQDER
jgi:hypothetical protein